jgi:hypothetical protein
MQARLTFPPFALTYRPHLRLTSRANSPTTLGRDQRLFVVTLPLRLSGLPMHLLW